MDGPLGMDAATRVTGETSGADGHLTILHVVTSPSAIPAGGEVVLELSVHCAGGCDVRDTNVVVSGQLDSHVSTHRVCNVAGDVRVVRAAPACVGEETLTLRLELPPRLSVDHHGETVTVSFATLPHQCSFAVWDVPGAVSVEDMFTPTVGISCRNGCVLGREHIEVLDQEGKIAAEATLSDEPWPGTEALYTAHVPLCAPPVPGQRRWTFRVVQGTSDRVPHVIPGAAFEPTICARPEHNVTISIVDAETRLPIADADVRLGPYRALTNEQGIARIGAARGAYVLDAWKAGYADCDGGLMQIDGDIAIALQTATVAQARPEDDQVWM
jgi:hypothetical protein